MKNALVFGRILSMIVLFFSFSMGYGQEPLSDPTDDSKKKKVSGGYGYAAGGYGSKDMRDLNTFLGDDYFKSNGLTLGGGGLLMIRNILLGGEGISFFKQEATIGSQKIAHESGWGQFYAGYVLMSKKGMLLYPKVGIGGYKQSLILTNQNAVTTMDTVFTGAYTGTQLLRKGMVLSFGLGFEWMPGFDETAGSGIVFGVDVGYNLDALQKEWEAYGTALGGSSPNVYPTGFYARLHIGFGGWNRQ